MEHTNDPSQAQPPPPRRRSRVWHAANLVLLTLVVLCMVAWAVPAILWSDLPAAFRPVAAILFVAATAALLVFVRPRRRGVFLFLTLFFLVVAWWLRIPASNTRDWQPEVAVLAGATLEGNKVTIQNIRNCDYRTEDDFSVRHYDRTFDLDKLRTADLYIVYWGSPMIAHTMLSFGFEGHEYVCVSIETRKERGEGYSAVKGFFKQYELVYVVADERDVVRLRTNYRGEDVYLYRLRAAPELVRKVFLDYMKEINSLNERPQWYNALTQNCTTSIRGHTRAYAQRRWPSWRLILNGGVDQLGYENGALDQSLPFLELKARSRINDRGIAAGNDPAFSRRIREGLPGMEEHE